MEDTSTNPDAAQRRVRSPSPNTIRAFAFLSLLLVIALGLASRSAPLASVPLVGTYFGDATWAIAAYAVFRMISPSASVASIAIAALVLSIAVEFSQLWQPAWLQELRAYRAVALLIGRGFVWWDLLAYVIGILVAAWTEVMIRKRVSRSVQSAE